MTVTTADIIKKGDYLSSDFNPNKLTIAQLTGLLGYHEKPLPPIPHTKDRLINQFNQEIKAKSAELLQERILNLGATVAPRSVRRVSRKFGTGTKNNGWEDNNIFQSSASPNDVRESTSTRAFFHESLSESPRAQPETTSVLDAIYPALSQYALPQNSTHWPGLRPVSANFRRADHRYTRDDILHEEEDSQTYAVEMIGEQRRLPSIQSALVFGFILALLGSLLQYKIESAPIGYCDKDSLSNEKITELQIERVQLEACREQQAVCEEIICPSYGFFFPEACTPCPRHASCHLENVICDDGYMLSPHPLSFVPIISAICDGLPGLGPVAFPSKCVEDTSRKKSLIAMEEGIDSILAIERGRRICTDEFQGKSFEGGEAQRWGLEITTLKDSMKKKALMTEDIDVLFGEAIRQLLDYGYVIKGEDAEGRLFLATEHIIMSWNCQVKVAVENTWKEWRKLILGTIISIIFVVSGRAQLFAKRDEDRRVSELVRLALDTLRNQKLSHQTQNLPSLQLRDLFLQDEHSIAVRTRLWARVERIVEGNANVRANMEELAGGDELRVWRWVGTGGLRAPLRDSDIGQRSDIQ